MKALTTFIVILLLGCADGELNGRKYKLKKECIEYKMQSVVRLNANGGTRVDMMKVCTQEKVTDTIWID